MATSMALIFSSAFAREIFFGQVLELCVPFEIEHRRQRIWVRGHVQHEPQRLLMRRPAPIEEMVGAPRHARVLRALPILEELRIEMIAAFGGLDEGEPRAGGAGLRPIDFALPGGDIDALHRHGVGRCHAFMRLGVGQPACAGGERARTGRKQQDDPDHRQAAI